MLAFQLYIRKSDKLNIYVLILDCGYFLLRNWTFHNELRKMKELSINKCKNLASLLCVVLIEEKRKLGGNAVI